MVTFKISALLLAVQLCSAERMNILQYKPDSVLAMNDNKCERQKHLQKLQYDALEHQHLDEHNSDLCNNDIKIHIF